MPIVAIQNFSIRLPTPTELIHTACCALLVLISSCHSLRQKSFMSLGTKVQIMHFHIRSPLPHHPKFIFALSKLVNSSGQVDFALGIYSWESELKYTLLYSDCMHYLCYYHCCLCCLVCFCWTQDEKYCQLVQVHYFELFENVLSKMLACSKGT